MSDTELVEKVKNILKEKSTHPITDLHEKDVLREVMDSLEYWDCILGGFKS